MIELQKEDRIQINHETFSCHRTRNVWNGKPLWDVGTVTGVSKGLVTVLFDGTKPSSRHRYCPKFLTFIDRPYFEGGGGI